MKKYVYVTILVLLAISTVAALYLYTKVYDEIGIYKINMQEYQGYLNITDFEVSCDSQYGTYYYGIPFIFGHKQLNVELTVKGYLQNEGKQLIPYIKNLQIAETMIYEKGERPKTFIEVYPIVDTKSDRIYDGGKIPYTYHFKYKLRPYAWGQYNLYTINCGGIERTFEVLCAK